MGSRRGRKALKLRGGVRYIWVSARLLPMWSGFEGLFLPVYTSGVGSGAFG